MAARKPKAATLKGCEVLVGVTGGIAAYKTAMLVSRLVQAGAGVSVVMTEHAKRFVGALTFQTLTRRPVASDLFAEGVYDADSTSPAEPTPPKQPLRLRRPEAAGGLRRAGHIALADRAEVAVVAPATANCLAKLAAGIADDLLSTVLLAVRCPLVLAPAMNEVMWNHPAVQANVTVLRERGMHLVGPETGRLACGTEGVGRMAEPETILAEVVRALTRAR
jgi:phosphopantothenoylcysteine decarboxylase/phosphopantothenate--cysteine ligase